MKFRLVGQVKIIRKKSYSTGFTYENINLRKGHVAPHGFLSELRKKGRNDEMLFKLPRRQLSDIYSHARLRRKLLSNTSFEDSALIVHPNCVHIFFAKVKPLKLFEESMQTDRRGFFYYGYLAIRSVKTKWKFAWRLEEREVSYRRKSNATITSTVRLHINGLGINNTSPPELTLFFTVTT